MNLKQKKPNLFNLLSAALPLLSLIGFIFTATVFPGRADGMSLLGVFMLPGEIFILATIGGTLAAILSLIRHEPLKWLSLVGLVTNGSIVLVFCISALSII